LPEDGNAFGLSELGAGLFGGGLAGSFFSSLAISASSVFFFTGFLPMFGGFLFGGPESKFISSSSPPSAASSLTAFLGAEAFFGFGAGGFQFSGLSYFEG